MLGSKVEAYKPPINYLKIVGVIEITHLYGASGSFVLLRPKNRVKLLTQSAENWICMRKWAVPCGAIYFSCFRRPFTYVHIFSGAPSDTNVVPEKG